jgi:hypothetical protein
MTGRKMLIPRTSGTPNPEEAREGRYDIAIAALISR